VSGSTFNQLFDPSVVGAPQNTLAPQPTWADAWQFNAQAAQAELERQRAISAQRGLWNDQGITPAGARDAATQAAMAPIFGTAAPGVRGFHGSPYDFERFDTSKLHPDEAGHYFAQDEKLAQDYAGRSSRDPTAGHMYEVNIKADPAKFLDYGGLGATEQDALNDPGAVQKLIAAGVPGIRFPDKTMVVFDANTIEILRKYGLAGLMAGGLGAAATAPQQ